MNQANEQMDMMEDLLQQLIHKFTSVEEKITRIEASKQSDHLADLNIFNEELVRFKRNFNEVGERLAYQTSILTDKIATIPNEMPVQHHHLFDKWSKAFIISSIVLLLFASISVGACLSLWSENKLLHENALKYRMIRVADPAIATWVDSTYYRNPEEAEQATEKYEALGGAKHQIEETAKEKMQETKRTKKPRHK